MLATPRDDLKANTPEWETIPHIAATGFREYDARWKYGIDINLMGFQALGMALGTMVVDDCAKKGVPPRIVVGHDYRDYSLMLKHSLIVGLMSAGCEVNDIGLALSPVAYFAQFEYDCAAVAMVTASHNEKPWTGVKMGVEKPLTFGPTEMNALKDITLGGKWQARPGGAYVFHADARERYIADLLKDGPLKRKIRAVVACGNGTAAHYAPEVLAKLGVDVVPLDATLDYTFPRYNPNPEDHEMLHAMSEAVHESGAELALGFDGDGDRAGVCDEKGGEIFADKIGVMLARDLSALYPNRTFVADVKSTGLYAVDEVLKKNGATTDYWMTGHSHIKRRNYQLNALAAFEKSGHFFFNAPIGRGYDDGLVSAIAVLRMLERNPGKSMSQLYNELPLTHATLTMGPYCGDTVKYGVVDELVAKFVKMKADGELVTGQKITDVLTVNGVRFTTEDGTWGLIRASSNKPQLVVVAESPVSKARMCAMYRYLKDLLDADARMGEWDQTMDETCQNCH
ncbi:Phosphomannomutase/phosphoglucomutase [Alphaproteobacteria bacterium SO-S41]|nr:Phosphomannomutase/phosphoglucomutase [Alphaproteobacteria bacterium SO-S41]